MNNYRLLFILILMNISIETIAQSSVDSLRESNSNTKIALSDIIGNWYAGDSMQYEIRFITLDNFAVNIEGLNHGVGNYSFLLERDSLYVNGTAANWPPYDCTLNLLSKNVLEIKLYQYFSTEAKSITYIRK